MKPGTAHPGSTGKASVTGPHDENRVVEATGTLTGSRPGYAAGEQEVPTGDPVEDRIRLVLGGGHDDTGGGRMHIGGWPIGHRNGRQEGPTVGAVQRRRRPSHRGHQHHRRGHHHQRHYGGQSHDELATASRTMKVSGGGVIVRDGAHVADDLWAEVPVGGPGPPVDGPIRLPPDVGLWGRTVDI